MWLSGELRTAEATAPPSHPYTQRWPYRLLLTAATSAANRRKMELFFNRMHRIYYTWTFYRCRPLCLSISVAGLHTMSLEFYAWVSEGTKKQKRWSRDARVWTVRDFRELMENWATVVYKWPAMESRDTCPVFRLSRDMVFHVSVLA